MDWSYTEERRWEHRQSCTGVESTHVRAEGEKYHVDGMQENGKEQDEV